MSEAPPVDFRPDLVPTIRSLEIHAKRSALSQTLTGNWLSRIKGHGIEFTGYRQYTSGDDAGLIDWKASVRSRKLLVRELNEEKNLNIIIFLDVSDTMLFGTTDKLKAEYAAELVCSLSFAALRAGESVGLAMWSDRIRRFVETSQGTAHHAVLMKALSNPAFYGGQKDIARSANQLTSLMNNGLVVIVSDFIGYDEKWEKYLRVLATKEDVVAIMVRDPRDRRLPASGEYVLSDPSTGQKLVVDAKDYAEPYRRYVELEEQRVRTLLHHAHSDLLLLETNEDYAKKLVHFFLIRGRTRASEMVFEVSFDQPVFLWLLFSIPLLVFTHLYFLHHAKRKAIRFANFTTLQRVTGRKLLTTNSLLLVMRSVVIICLVFAAAGVTIWRDTPSGTTDVVLVIDASASMAATDMDGPRIDAAKAAAKTFVQQLDKAVSVGVVQFSGLAEVKTPPTTSRATVLAAIDDVQVRTIGGTDIAGAVVTGTNLLAGAPNGRAIVLLTDGVASVSLYDSNPVERAIAYARANHVVIHTIGVGTPGGDGFLPGLAAQAQSFDEQNLQTIANSTGGQYAWARSPEQLASAYGDVLGSSSVAIVPVRANIGFVLLALILVFFEWGLINTRYRILP